MSYSIPIRNRYKVWPGDATVRSLSLRSATRTVMGHTRCVSLPLAAIPSACPKRCPARRQVPQFHAPRTRGARAPSDTLLPHSASEHDRTLSDARRRLHTRATSPHRPPLRKQEPFATHSGGKQQRNFIECGRSWAGVVMLGRQTKGICAQQALKDVFTWPRGKRPGRSRNTPAWKTKLLQGRLSERRCIMNSMYVAYNIHL